MQFVSAVLGVSPQAVQAGGRSSRSSSTSSVLAESDNYSKEQRRMSNEGRREIFGLTHRQIAFVCECDLGACYDTVLLTAVEYDDCRRRGLPITAASHA